MKAVFACLAIVLLSSTAFAVEDVKSTSTTSSTTTTCTSPSGGNLYKRAHCAQECYTSFCACLNRGYSANHTAIADNAEPNDMAGLGCLNYFWGSCSLLQSCTAELIECSKYKASSTCKPMLSLAALGLAAAPDAHYNTSAPLQKSCEYTACDIFNRTKTYWGSQVCSLTTAQVNATCINPGFFRGTLRFRADVYRLQWDESYATNLRAAVQKDLNAIFSGMTVQIQSATGQQFLTVEFTVDRRASDTALKAAMTFGQASKYWLYSTASFFGNTSVGWDYFGPRIHRVRSAQCFSNSRTIPYVAVSGTGVEIDVIGKNESGCLTGSLDAVRTLKIVASLPNHVNVNEYSWNHRHLIHDARNADAGTVTLSINSTSGTGVATVHCDASDTLYDVSLQTSTMTYHYGKIQCVKAYPGKATHPPANITAWVSTDKVATVGRLLLAAWSNAGSSTNLAVTAGVLGNLPIDYVGTSFTAFQNRVNSYADGTSALFVADSCAAVANKTFAFATRSSLVILGGNYYGTGCTGTATVAAFNAVQSIVANADVILTDSSVDPAIMKRSEVRSVTVGHPRDGPVADRQILERYQRYRLERQSAVCTQTTATSLPTALGGYIGFQGTVYFHGVCDIAACGFGGMWSTNVASNGRSCVLPMITSWFWGDADVLLKKTDGTIVKTNSKIAYEWTDAIYTSTWSATRDNELRVYTYTDAPACYQLRCLNSAKDVSINALTKYGGPQCVTSYQSYSWSNYWVYHWYTVYGWKRYFYGWNDIVFPRPNASTAPGACRSLILSKLDGDDQIFSLNLPLDAALPRGTTEGAQGSNENMAFTDLVPVSPSLPHADRNSWCRAWAQADSADLAVRPSLEEADNCFQCPARIIPTMPWGLWRIWWWGRNWWWWRESQIGNSQTEACYQANARWAGGAQNWERRCCYDISKKFIGAPLITEFPSRLRVTTGWAWPNWFEERVLYSIAEAVPEKVCCEQGTATPQTCGPFRDRRPVGQGTTAPFRNVNSLKNCDATWSPRPPAGWGRGDPYCTTYDGAGFECNFWGEALWTGCNGWKVHVTAVPVTTTLNSTATIINGVAVREGNDTVVVLRNPITGKHNVTLNDVVIEENTDSAVLDVTFDQNDKNNSLIRISSASGHVVEVEVKPSFLVVGTTPNRTCIGKCMGLLGNCDGDKSNDLKNMYGNVSLAENATGSEIYHKVVLSFVVDKAHTLFPGEVSVPPVVNTTANVTEFVPTFITNATLASCPAVCNSEPGCCLDASIAGTTFANQTAAAVSTIQEVSNQSVPLVGYNWPPQLLYPSRTAVLKGLKVMLIVNASDADGLRSLSIDICTGTTGVTCTTPVSTNANKSSIQLEYTADANVSGTITAVDQKGKTNVGFFDIVALPPPAAPAISVTVSFSIVGSGAWSASEVYNLRSSVNTDLANTVNAYYSTGAGSSASFQPATTTASDFSMGNVANKATTDGSVQVDVTSYVTGTTQQEAQARADALKNSKIALPTFEAELKKLVPGASLGTSTAVEGTQSPATATPSTTDSSTTDAPSSASSGVSGLSMMASVLVAVLAVFLL